MTFHSPLWPPFLSQTFYHMETQAAGADEAILDTQGFISEGSAG